MAQNRIPWYSNGNCPLNRLIVIREGWNSTDGNWQHRLPRATLRRFNKLVDITFRRTGRILVITAGWATDRPYDIQVIAKRLYGIYAATPGKSSHGMVFEGQQTAAIDVGNWAWCYQNHGGYDQWQKDIREAGFTRLPNGYQQSGEEHHIIDWNPWDDEPEYGGASAGNEEEMAKLDGEDMNWLREMVRQEVGGGLSVFTGTIADAVASQAFSDDNKGWMREGFRQEIGGALSGFTEPIASAVTAAVVNELETREKK